MDVKHGREIASLIAQVQSTRSEHVPHPHHNETLTPIERFTELGNRIKILPFESSNEDGVLIHRVKKDLSDEEVNYAVVIDARYTRVKPSATNVFDLTRTLESVTVGWFTNESQQFVEERIVGFQVDSGVTVEALRLLALVEESLLNVEQAYEATIFSRAASQLAIEAATIVPFRNLRSVED